MRGNLIAAVGMAIAVVATLLIDERIGDWRLIVVGVGHRHRGRRPGGAQVKMTAMPQMVALFNGVGGGAVALIAWVEFRERRLRRRADVRGRSRSCFAAIIGSISFWGSNIAFAKLQEILPARPIIAPDAQQVINLALLLVAVACAAAIVGGSDAEILLSCCCWQRRSWASSWCCRSAAPTCRS